MKRSLALATSVLFAGLNAVHADAGNTTVELSTFDIVRPLAKRGDIPAQYSMGYMYAEGAGTVKDYDQAAFWYSRAADKGHNGAKYQLYELYLAADNPSRSLATSLRWLAEAADSDHALAQHELGRRYYLGEGVPLNYLKAQDWLKKSAEKGYAPARVLIAELNSRRLDKLHSVNVRSINVRSKASGSSRIVGTVRRGQQVIVTETVRGWAKIESDENDTKGWVAKRFLKKLQ